MNVVDPSKGNCEIFSVGVSIPNPGLTSPKVGGINVRIEGALSAGYQIGPGEIRNVKAEAAFNPFEDKPDLDIILTGQFYIGMNAHITGSIRGGVEISIAIASVIGGLGIPGTASLDGHVLTHGKLHYRRASFEQELEIR